MYKINSIEFHRNGVGGDPFSVVSFSDSDGELRGIVFEMPLVEDPDQVAYSVPNEPFSGVAVIRPNDPQAKFRGDYFARALRQVIADYESHLDQLWRDDPEWTRTGEGHSEVALANLGRLVEGSGSVVTYEPKVRQ